MNTKKSTLDLWLAKKKKKPTVIGIPKMPKNTPVPLSQGQQRLWLLQQLYPDNPFYQYAHAYRFKGALNVEALLASFQMVAQRHAVLRTTFIEVENEVYQEVKPEANVPTEVIDLQHFTIEKQQEIIRKTTREKAEQALDLRSDDLLSVTVLILAENDFFVLLSMHHIVGDRWSLQVLNEELATIYRELSAGENSKIAALEIQYSDYAYWQKSQPEQPDDLAYWKKHLTGELPVLALPTDFSRPSVPSFNGISTTKIFSSKLSDSLKNLAKIQNTTPFVVLLSAYKVLLRRYTGQDDLVVGTPFTNRDKTVLEKLIGFFNETLVLRSDLSEDPIFTDFLAQIKETTTKAFAHKNTSFDTLVRELKPKRNGTGNPLFQVMFLYNAVQKTPTFAPDLSVEESVVDLGVSKFDLTLFITDKGENLSATFEYATDLFAEDSIERLHRHLENILESIVTQPTQRLSELSILDADEREKMLTEWNNTAVEISENDNVLTFFEENVRKNPTATCVSAENGKLTYQEVNDRAAAVANGLCAQGIKDGMPVGLHVKRSTNLIVGIIAVLKSGGAYLPLDPEYPAERIEYMLSDAEVKVVLTQEEIRAQLPQNSAKILTFSEASAIEFKENISPQEIDNQQLAYIIYTSGSTGKPKGVPITHKNLWYSTAARFEFYKHQPGAFLLMSSFAFDSSVAGIFWTLTQGGNLVIPRKRIEQDIEALAAVISEEKVTHTLMLPSLYDVLLKHASTEKLQSLNTVMVAGEACTSAVVQQHFSTLPQAKLYNEYGPTEGTVWCTAHEIQSTDTEGVIPIGRPIPNVQNYILDAQKQPVPIGVAGELYIAGNGLSQGYLHRPELTKEKFVEVNFSTENTTRLYRTGDLARYRADGIIEFLGRADRQVKIRGYRIEPDEIKSVLQQQPGVKEAVISVISGGGQKRLVAYFTTENEVSVNELRANLKALLPAYMVPAVFVPLSEFPRLPNGKINENALPQPDETSTIDAKNYVAPQGEIEAQLADIWQAVLQQKQVGRHDNFFDIGGDSILSIQIISKARNAGFTLAANQLFENQTIAELAQAIDKSKGTKSLTINDLKNKEITNYSLSFMQSAFLLHSLQSKNDQGFLQLEFTLAGKIQPALWEKAWEQNAERHAVLRTSIDWKNAAQPTQIIHPKVDLTWNYLDWSAHSEGEQKEKLKTFRAEDAARGFDLSQAPISRFSVIQLSENRSLLFWTCHHILLDGWSGGLVLKDALHFYAAAQNGTDYSLERLPSYSAFLDWQSNKSEEPVREFWSKYFADYTQTNLFEKDGNSTTISDFSDLTFCLSEQKSKVLNDFARKNRVTLNTLLKSVWGLLLSRYFGTEEVTFGATVSGRNADFPMLDKMSGLFMNVLPTRLKVNNHQDFSDWLSLFQQEQTAVNAFDQTTLEEINNYANLPKHNRLFDSLFVFGNFLKDGMSVGNLSVEDFAGGFTSTYPLTVRVNPIAALEFDLRYDKSIISEEKIDWFRTEFMQLLELFTEANLSFKRVAEVIPIPAFSEEKNTPKTRPEELFSQEKSQETYVAPRNPTELQLTKIWEKLFARSPIGVTENFFDIGGKSLLAMQLFSEIEEKMDCILPPITLMQHSTIEALAQQISGDTVTEVWDTIVPLRASGSKTPLFCIHAGGAHIFFYEGLTRHLSAEQPVYAIQPRGLDGYTSYHKTIEEMAAHYIEEIRKIQPDGHYQLLGTCFGNAVCLEMANQLKAMNFEVSMFIVDSAPAHLIPLEKSKPVSRFLSILQSQNWQLLYRKVRRRILIYKKKVAVKPLSEAQKQLQKTIDSLNTLYAAYTWTPFTGKITLIRSTQFAHQEGKRFHLTQWQKLAKGGLEVHVTEGRHLTIFDEPAVQGVAAILEECLQGEEL